jgi:pilus assembly protein Flp/PilA
VIGSLTGSGCTAAGVEGFLEEVSMKSVLRTLNNLHREESGQDLIEYALVVALIALAATAGMSSLANGINSAFDKVNVILGNKIS